MQLFIDDECNLNDSGEFSRSFHLIYPSDLHLKYEHNGIQAAFLELNISIVEGLFIYKLYDKRDDFPFHIQMPDKKGNIPLHVILWLNNVRVLADSQSYITLL